MRLFLCYWDKVTRFLQMLPFFLLVYSANSSIVGATPNPKPAVEQWILKTLTAGQVADLAIFPDENDHVVSASFLKQLLTNNIAGAKIPAAGIQLLNAVVSDKLDLTNEKIPFSTRFDNCKFKESVVFRDAVFTSNLLLNGASFEGPADFVSTIIGGNFDANQTVFNGPTQFYKATVKQNFEADGASFNDADTEANFEGIKVSGYIFLRQATFKGLVRFYRANVSDNLQLNEAHFLKSADFRSMVIKGHAIFRGTTLEAPVSFFGTKVNGNFETDGAHFNGAEFSELKSDGVGFPQTTVQGTVSIDDMNFQRITSGVPNDVVLLANHSNNPLGVYAELEQYYRRTGNLTEADAIYLRQREIARSRLPFGPSWIVDSLLNYGVKYGKRPWYAILWSAIFILIGAWVFRGKELMESRDPNARPRYYNAFLYSLDLFLPIVDLHAESAWMPRKDYVLGQWYLACHVLFGWILVTLFVAALTGFVK